MALCGCLTSNVELGHKDSVGQRSEGKTCKIPTPSTGPTQLFLHLVPAELQQEKRSLTGKTRNYEEENGKGESEREVLGGGKEDRSDPRESD